MNDLEAYKTRKDGNYTPEDVLKQSQKTIKQHGVKRMIVIIQDQDDIIYRYNTELDTVELAGLLEATKMFEFCD